jgi:hypothetical protein
MVQLVRFMKVKLKHAELSGDFEILMKLADKHKTLGIRTNAETAERM